MTEHIADIYAYRNDAQAEYDGFDAIEASIRNPRGKLPDGAFEAAQEFVKDLNVALPDGRKKPVGKITYEDGGDEFEITAF